MIYENEKIFKDFVRELNHAIEDCSWKMYLQTHEFPKIYFNDYNFLPTINYLSAPYYDEIPVVQVKNFFRGSNNALGFNTGDMRVISSIDYILTNSCLPLSVVLYEKNYFILDGRHRFYAHLILGRKTLPVSVHEIANDESEQGNMITIAKPFQGDSLGLAIPEKALDFFERYHIFFKSIYCVELYNKNNKSILQFTLENGDVISFFGCCSAGNNTRSSVITCELLKKCGFLVDMEFISSNKEFCLNDKNDANKINFNMQRNLEVITETIIPALRICKRSKRPSIITNKYNKPKKVLSSFKNVDLCLVKLYDYIIKGNDDIFQYEPLSSYMLQVNNQYFFIVEVIKNTNERCIYIFLDNCLPFNNLTIKFIGAIDEEDSLFKFITN